MLPIDLSKKAKSKHADRSQLIALLNKPDGYNSFQSFLQQQALGRVNDLSFWSQARNFYDHHPSKSEKERRDSATKICQDFLEKTGLQPISNKDEKLAARVVSSVEKGKLPQTLFSKLEDQVINNLAQEYWQQYQSSNKKANSESSRNDMIRSIKSPSGFTHFMNYLTSHHTEEFLIFWRAVEELHNSKDEYETRQIATSIYQDHIDPACPHPFTASTERKKQDVIDCFTNKIISKTMFDALQSDCFSNLEQIWVQQYCSSQEYAKATSESQKIPMKKLMLGKPVKSCVDLIETQVGFTQLLECMKRHHCEEHLLFWKKVELLHQVTDTDEIISLATEIYDAHLAKGCEIPITTSTEMKKQSAIQAYTTWDFSPNMFDVIQADCLSVIEEFWTTTYQTSPEYAIFQIESPHLKINYQKDEMLEFISEKQGFEDFQKFLRSKLADEFLLFWKKVQDFHALVSADEIKKTAMEIYNAFISSGCPTPVQTNFSAKKRLVATEIEKEAYSVTMFDGILEDCIEMNLSPHWVSFQERETPLGTPRVSSIVGPQARIESPPLQSSVGSPHAHLSESSTPSTTSSQPPFRPEWSWAL